MFGEGFRHEAGDFAVSAGDFFGRVFQPCSIVRGGQSVGVDEIRLDLAWTIFALDALQPCERARSAYHMTRA